jgi:hypothetical protein
MSTFEHTAMPWEAVPGNEHHGPYITTAFGSTVCDLYAMSQPVFGSQPSKPVSFTDADQNVEAIVRACNAHDRLVEIAKTLRQHLSLFCGPDDAIANEIFALADAAIASAEGN